jgi:hypothetical protein
MSYLDRLKVKISETNANYGATKGSEGAFVPFVAYPLAPLHDISTVTNFKRQPPTGSETTKLLQQFKQHKGELFEALKQEERREKVLEMLQADSELKYAVIADLESDANKVILTIGLRDLATTFEMLIPKESYDPWQLIALVEAHGMKVTQ